MPYRRLWSQVAHQTNQPTNQPDKPLNLAADPNFGKITVYLRQNIATWPTRQIRKQEYYFASLLFNIFK